MRLSFRKSFKAGPVRINLSKSGIGASVGVKGLRVGVNAKGKSYISGGTGGVFFSNNLSQNKNGNNSNSINASYSVASNPQAKPSQFGNLRNLLLLWFILFIFSIMINSLFLLFAPYTVILLFVILYKQSMQKKMNNIKREIKEAIQNKNLNKIDDIMNKIDLLIPSINDRRFFLLEVYPDLVNSFLLDGKLEKIEENILRKCLDDLPSDIVAEINTNKVNELLESVIADKKITLEEEELMRRCIEIFKLQHIQKNVQKEIEDFKELERKEEIEDFKEFEKIVKKKIEEDMKKTIADYKELEKLEKEGLSVIQPQINVNDPSDCYYENDAVILKTKVINGIKKIIIDFEGKILITKENFHIIGDGHKAIKNNIIIKAVKLADDVIELIICNRKTPLYLKVDNSMTLLGILRKIL